MQIVIDVPEEIIKLCKDDKLSTVKLSAEYFRNGTVLPEHGRLIDADKLWDAYHDLDYDFYEALDVAPTILEATGVSE